MDVTYYVADAITGDVVPGVTLDLEDATWTCRMPGGTFSATLRMNTEPERIDQQDFAYSRRIMEVLEPGRYTIAPVLNGVSLGEWLIWRLDIDDVTGRVQVAGIEWGLYPKYRSLEVDYLYTNRDQGLILFDLLTDCYKIGQPVRLTVPVVSVGQTVSIDQKKKTAYYGDFIADQLPQIEWFVWARLDDTTTPTRVLRDVIFTYGKRQQRQPVSLIAPPLGTSGGALLSWRRIKDFAKSATSFYGFGRGQGDVQPWADRWNPTMQDGRLIVTKFGTFSEFEDKASLQYAVDAAAYLAERPDEPIQASVNLDDFAVFPRVSDAFEVVIDPRPTYPAGLTAWFRVGETSIKTSGDRPVIDLLMEPV